MELRGEAKIIALVIAAGVAACRRSSVDGADGASPSSFDASASDAIAAGAPVVDAAVIDPAAADAGAAQTGALLAADPFGVAKTSKRAACGAFGPHVTRHDQETSFVDGDDLLAIVNRAPTGQLPPEYAPSDLVELRTNKPMTASDCEKTQCLRREAAAALDELLAAMRSAGFPGKVESAFRSYGAQCGTFGNWSRKSSFCEATEQSALPGHSQHQLGTTVDLFTEEWAKDERGVFREGFGCTPAGKYIREHATEFGFVMPYPIHPDDRHPKQHCVARWDIPVNINPRTGYRFEHWHIRYVGKAPAARFQTALAASGIDKPTEITVEQWLRSEKGIAAGSAPDAELPTCDGCNCGACSTLAKHGESACDKKGGALHLDEHGKVIIPDSAPSITSVSAARGRKWHGKVVEVHLDVPIGTVTQSPIVGLDAAGYAPGATYEKLAPFPETEPRSFPALAGAWVVAIEPVPNDTGTAWPYRAGIAAAAHAPIYDKANVLLPTRGGAATLKVPLPAAVKKVKVTLLQGGAPKGQERSLDLP